VPISAPSGTLLVVSYFFFFQAEDGIREIGVTGVQTCALPILQGVVPKTTEAAVLVGAVRLVLSGGRYVPESILSKEGSGFGEPNYSFDSAGLDRLTRRQMDVLEELGRGASNQEIGTQLGIALATVKLHVNAILNTLGVRNRTEAAIIAYKAGLTDVNARA